MFRNELLSGREPQKGSGSGMESDDWGWGGRSASFFSSLAGLRQVGVGTDHEVPVSSQDADRPGRCDFGPMDHGERSEGSAD